MTILSITIMVSILTINTHTISTNMISYSILLRHYLSKTANHIRYITRQS